MKTAGNKKLSPERLRKIEEFKKLTKKIRASGKFEKYFND